MENKILFCSRNIEYKTPFGAIREFEKVRFNIKMSNDYKDDTIALILRSDDYKDTFKYILTKIATDKDFNIYTTEFFVEKKGLYFYRFEIYGHTNTLFCGRNSAGELDIGDFLPEWQLTVYDKNFKTPRNFKGGIMYQIFPDRFSKADITIKDGAKNERIIREDWGGTPDFIYNTQNYTATDFFMGNIKGIIEKLPYIKSLGTTVIYLNPIFEAASNHRYNTADYTKVDPFLGTNEDFKKLCEKAKALEIEIILDGVFSHTGDDSIYFNKYSHYPSNGAYNSDNSPYKSWYTFYDNKDIYDCWWGFKTLPNVRETDRKYLDFITGPHGVLHKWQELGAKGWRLDVADELPDLFIERLRTRVKETDPNALIIGEVWEDATTKLSYGSRRKFLLGDELDTVMNYVWKDSIIKLLKTHDVDGFINEILEICENYPRPCLEVLMNLLSTHDTERILTVLGLYTSEYPAKENSANFSLSDEQYKLAEKLLLSASTILYFLPGIPCVYYGDEIGMQGLKDPYNRVCFREDMQNEFLLDHFRRLGKLRANNKGIFSGSFEIKKEHALLKITRAFGNKFLKLYVNLNDYDVTIYRSNIKGYRGFQNNHLEQYGFIITEGKI
ncbi:MAG: glycoside hydrolase family 13 protein [Clostridia bacterium]